MIQLTGLGLMRGQKVLLENADATIHPGQKFGLIGRNGCGKSSLFALLQGHISSDTGQHQIPQQWRVISVAQETPSTELSALDYVISGDARVVALQQQLAQAEAANDGAKIATLHGQIEEAGGYTLNSRAAVILAGLGFDNSAQQQAVNGFSGGWRMRLNLARALLCESDLLLLDEPTNHLDLDAVYWLEKWLQQYSGTLLLISHDKAFLDATVGHILSFEGQALVSYSGNYSSYERQRLERSRLQQLAIDKQQKKQAHLTAFIKRFGAKASKAKQAQSRVKQLEKMVEILPVIQESSFSFDFLEPEKLPNPLIHMEQVQVGYGDKVILDNIHLNLVPGSRIGLLGRNGAGKSTLIKLLAETLTPLAGKYACSAGLKVGYFAQHQMEYLQPEWTPLQHLQQLDLKASEHQLRGFLGGFGFGEEALQPVAPMSGGEKARLVLALIVYQRPNLLLLDEPTNHLDLSMRQTLNLALQQFSGAMVLVSHDRFLLSSVCDQFYLVNSGQVEAFSGDLDDYGRWLVKQASQSEAKAKPEQTSGSSTKVDRKQAKRAEAEQRKMTAPLRKQIEKAEKQMLKLESQQSDIEQQLSDPGLYEAQNKEQLQTLLSQQVTVKKQLNETEEQWLADQEALELMLEELSQGE